MSKDDSDTPRERARLGTYANSAVDSFADPPPANSRWVGWLVGSCLLLLAVPAQWLGLGAVAVAILLATTALAVRDRRRR